MIDILGNLFSRVIFNWNYTKGEVACSMPSAILKFSKKLYYQESYLAPIIAYSQKIQIALDDLSPALDKKNNTFVCQIVSFALYIARALDIIALVARNDTALEQCNITTKTLNA